MQISGQLYALAALPRGNHYIGSRMSPFAGMDIVEKRKISPVPGIEPHPNRTKSYAKCKMNGCYTSLLLLFRVNDIFCFH
jgi:hypothetical protein